MQPPPRKTKISVSQLKTLHSEQISKLQNKHQHELELLEDIRVFSKQRSSIEKEYAQALCKLAQQYLSKGKFTPPPVLSEDGKDTKTVSEVWKTVLEETDRVGKIRLQAADTYLQQISEPIKPIKSSKATVAKKVFEQLKVMHKEIDVQVQELSKSQKIYNEDEHVTLEATSKANEANAKVKNKSTGIFTSLAKLQQQSAKLNSRKEACEVKSTASRNEYLLNLAATNAHLDMYYTSELPEVIKSLDGEMFDKVRDFFITLSKMEVDCCGLTQERFMKILTDSTMISQTFDYQCFLHTNLVFTDKVQYTFEPQENDPVNKISLDHNAAEHLNQEAKKLAERVAEDSKIIRINQRKLNLILNQSTNGTSRTTSENGEPQSPTSPIDNDAKVEELKQAIRKAKLSKKKAEAKLEALRQGGVKVDEYLSWAMAQAEAEESVEEEVSGRASVSVHSESISGTNAGTTTPGGASTTGTRTPGGTSIGSRPASQALNDAGDENNKPRNRSLSQADGTDSSVTSPPPEGSTYVNYQEDDFDETFAVTNTSPGIQQEEGSVGYSSLGQNIPLKAVVMYDFQASNSDELSITENETIEVIGEGEGDGWVQARNAHGQIGLVPQNYLQYTDQASAATIEDQNEMNVDHDTNGDFDSAAASAGYESSSIASASAPTSAGYDSVPPSAGYDVGTQGSHGEKTSVYSTTDYEVQQAVRPSDIPTDGMWARALYDFQATSDEELSFQEGQLIKILQKDENGVDDGWWKGEINGKVGVFPSLVVEEICSDFTSEDVASPCRPGPPAFTPPEPGPPPPQLEVTQPTPSDESGPTVATSNAIPPPPPPRQPPVLPPEEQPPAAEPPSEAEAPVPAADLSTSAEPIADGTVQDPSEFPPPPPDGAVEGHDGEKPEASSSEDQNDDNLSTCVNVNSDSMDTFSTTSDVQQKEATSCGDGQTGIGRAMPGEADQTIGDTVIAEVEPKRNPCVEEQIVEVEVHKVPDDDGLDFPPPPPPQLEDAEGTTESIKLSNEDYDAADSIL